MTSNTGLTLSNLRIAKDGETLIHLDTHVGPSTILTIMGPSGSGKSTLLAALIGNLNPVFSLTGQVILDGQDITHTPTQNRRVGIMFQDPLLFPHMSVAHNLAFGLPPSQKRRPDRMALIEEALDDIGLARFGPRDPSTLSGGQKARVALMRVLLADPCALLLDEPFSGLDANLRGQIRSLVFDRAKTRDLPTILVTHDAEDAEAAGDNVITIG